jgi:hypothetical protein
VRWVTRSELIPINNIFNTTVMPMDFRFKIVAIMVANLVTLIAWYVESEQLACSCAFLFLSIVYICVFRQVYVVHGCVHQRLDEAAADKADAESQSKAALSEMPPPMAQDLSEQPMVVSIAETNA